MTNGQGCPFSFGSLTFEVDTFFAQKATTQNATAKKSPSHNAATILTIWTEKIMLL
jgi:hypothetical protein